MNRLISEIKVKSPIWRSLLVALFILAILYAIYEFKTTGRIKGFVQIGFLLSAYWFTVFSQRKLDVFEHLIEELPADHKLITSTLSVVDVGNIRIFYRTYSQKKDKRWSFITYLSMEMGIVYPHDAVMKKAMLDKLQLLILKLEKDGMLAGCLFASEEENEEECASDNLVMVGQPLILEFHLKTLTAAWLAELQSEIIALLAEYKIPEQVFCTIKGSKAGTIFSYHIGNVRHSQVIYGAQGYYLEEYKIDAMLWIGNDAWFPNDRYEQILGRVTARMGQNNLGIQDLTKILRRMSESLHPSAKIRVSQPSSHELSVKIKDNVNQESETYILSFSSNMWWLYCIEEVEKYYPVSCHGESAACELLLSILSEKYLN